MGVRMESYIEGTQRGAFEAAELHLQKLLHGSYASLRILTCTRMQTETPIHSYL